MSHTLILTDDLVIKGRIIKSTIGINQNAIDVIELDITIRVNAKLRNFICTFYMENGTLKNYQEWYQCANVLEGIGYMEFTAETSMTSVMDEWIKRIKEYHNGPTA